MSGNSFLRAVLKVVVSVWNSLPAECVNFSKTYTYQSINQSSFISGMTERRPRMRNKHNIHSNSSRVTCLIFVFIEHSCNEVRV